jgi:hypothetical protein
MAKTFTKLTRPAIRKLALGDKLNEHGITFERQANGDGLYTVNVMVDGLRIHRVIGRESDGTTRTQAEEFIDKARQDAKAGRLNLPKGRKLATDVRRSCREVPRQAGAGRWQGSGHEGLSPKNALDTIFR